jgi:glycosyltransferase involved in cell wall biosynthesis
VNAVTDKQALAPAAGRDSGEGALHVRLDAPLPEELGEGSPNAVFVCGWCFHPQARATELSLVVNGERQPVMAHGMPRLDVLRALHPGRDPYDTGAMASDPDSEEDPLLHSYASGFWGLARIPALTKGEVCDLSVLAELDGGAEVGAELARIPVTQRPEPLAVDQPDPSSGPLVAICMAAYEPAIDLFMRQVESIRGQSHRNWVCVVSDDCSSPQSLAAVEAVLGGDPRFLLSRSPRRLGFYRNFERALSLAPADAEFVAMVDQDDSWHPDKLETLLREIGDAQLAYSDQRIVARDGELISDTYWQRRRNNHSDLLSLLVANSVTGAASLFKRELLDYALPFPPAQFAHFHDHWVALTALALGDIAFVERPLYDYVQHGEAALGHAAANRMTALRDRLANLRRDPRERVRKWRMHYFVDVCRLTQFAEVLRLRCGGRMAPRKCRALEQFLRSDRSLPAIGRLAGRGARELVGRPETLGAEWMLAFAYTWRRALSASARQRPQRGLRLDAVPPASLAPKPGRSGPQAPAVRAVAEKVAPIDLAIRDDAPARVNILIPTIDLEHFFGGYIAKFNLAARLADRGQRVRIVTVDPVGPLPRSWEAQLEAYSGLAGLFERVEVAFGREAQGGLEVSRADSFVASTWWSAHIAASAVRALGGGRFLYLIQEYEPFTFPMGTFAALARESYELPHFALFSTELLRDYFRRHGIGVYTDGSDSGDARSAAFENAITPIDAPAAGELAGRSDRRLLFYARPEPHAARNMFELGVLALSRALEDGAFQGWELHGIGSIEAGRHLDLGGGARLDLLPRSEQDAYGGLLRGHDVGLSLMYTPHPSLVPIEMASAGLLTVTNSFENKTPEALAAISSNLITAEPTIDGVAAGLLEAAAGVNDFERRTRGSQVRWSRDWRQSFDDELLVRLGEFLGA